MIVLLFAVGIFFGAIGGILMKIGATQVGSMSATSMHEVIVLITKLLTNPVVIGGMAIYFLSAVAWLYLLTKLDISYVQPILALTYVATPILAIVFLGESVPAMRWIGICIIIAGVYVVARTSS